MFYGGVTAGQSPQVLLVERVELQKSSMSYRTIITCPTPRKHLRRRSDQPLLLDGQLANPFAGRGKDGVADRRRHRRDTRLAHSGRRLSARYQMHMRLAGRLV